MSRALAAVLVVLTLVVGVLAGIAAGFLLGPDGGPGAVAGGGTPTAAPTLPTTAATPSPSPTSLPTPLPSPSPSPSPTPQPTATPAPTPVLVAAPLTGLPVSPARARRHVVAVMIDDHSNARPQSGLADASVVWHAPAEGGIPRYMALFGEGDPPSVGPVRSARLYFIAWASEWNAVFVHSGGSPQALRLLRSRDGRGRLVYDADEFRYGGRFLYRISGRFAPHNVYTDARNLRRLAKEVGAKDVDASPVWRFAPDAPISERPKGGRIVVPYLANRVSYAYDRRTNRYLRSVSKEGRQVDAGTGERIGPRNVVIMVVDFRPLNDPKQRLEARVTGSGTAWIATNGRTVKGTWKKAAFDGPTRFFGPDGEPVTLTAGQTFVQVVPRGTRVSIQDGALPD